jgi:hypothetical protein
MYTRPEFSVEDGIKIQRTQLNHWRSVLKEHVYNELERFATKNNHMVKTGYEICRGNDLSVFVQNYKNNNG